MPWECSRPSRWSVACCVSRNRSVTLSCLHPLLIVEAPEALPSLSLFSSILLREKIYEMFARKCRPELSLRVFTAATQISPTKDCSELKLLAESLNAKPNFTLINELIPMLKKKKKREGVLHPPCVCHHEVICIGFPMVSLQRGHVRPWLFCWGDRHNTRRIHSCCEGWNLSELNHQSRDSSGIGTSHTALF